ncbi:hypothetical protein LTR04_000440, partial [Oleoguttula sp. CCFEE 6159]
TKKSYAAVKSVSLIRLSKKLKDNLDSEINILRSLQHPHIVALFDCTESPTHIHLVMEYCQLSDLSQFMQKRNTLGAYPETADIFKNYPNAPAGGLNEVVVRHFLKQTASAMEYLRARNLIHRDVKPQNLLLNPSPLYMKKLKPEEMPLAASENSLVPAVGVESLPMIKLADFGFARVLPTTSLAETLCGSPLYMAPEILRYERYDAKADLWSVGTVVYEMIAGKPPFRASNHVELLRKIEKGNDQIAFPDGAILSRDLKKLIRALLKKHPTERISFESFFSSSVIVGEIPGLVGEDRPRIPTRSIPDPEVSELSRRMQKLPTDAVPAIKNDEPIHRSGSPNPPSPRDHHPLSTPPRATSETRPSSVVQDPGVPQRPPSGDRRYTEALPIAPTPSSMQRQTSQRVRRPNPTSHATAPGRQELHQERSPVVAAVAMERRTSRNSTSPSSSYLKEQLERERNPQRRDDRAAREAREHAAQEIAFERDYVVVEKRAVEVNAFADELAASPQLHGNLRTQPSSLQHAAMVRRATTQGASNPTPGAQANMSRAMQVAAGRQRPDMLQRHTGSYDKRLGLSPTTATAALSKAINMASLRVFGIGASPPLGKGPSPPQGYGAFPTYPTTQGSPLMIGDGSKNLASVDEDTRILHTIEEAAHRSDVVFGFAEVKYKQLLPATPSNEHGLGVRRSSVTDKSQSEDTAEDDDLTVDAIVAISEEALVLYVKALAILAKAIDLAGSWWGQKNHGEIIGESTSPRDTTKSSAPPIGNRMNNVVQWARNRFNECLEKSEFVGRKLVDAQKQLPLDNPGHPSNHPSASTSSTSVGTSAENINLTSGVTAEKLMYDRAVEMSRAAAVNELVGEDLAGCELNYNTAAKLLEAVLESDDEPLSRRSNGTKKDRKPDDEVINGMETEDRQSVVKLIEGTKIRLAALKKKIAMQREHQASKRTSITNVVPSRTTTKASPVQTPLIATTPPK